MMYDCLIVQIRQLQHWFKPNGSDQFNPYEILEQAANAIEELSYKYQKALGDLAKQSEPPKEEV